MLSIPDCFAVSSLYSEYQIHDETEVQSFQWFQSNDSTIMIIYYSYSFSKFFHHFYNVHVSLQQQLFVTAFTTCFFLSSFFTWLQVYLRQDNVKCTCTIAIVLLAIAVVKVTLTITIVTLSPSPNIQNNVTKKY